MAWILHTYLLYEKYNMIPISSGYGLTEHNNNSSNTVVGMKHDYIYKTKVTIFLLKNHEINERTRSKK